MGTSRQKSGIAFLTRSTHEPGDTVELVTIIDQHRLAGILHQCDRHAAQQPRSILIQGHCGVGCGHVVSDRFKRPRYAGFRP